MIYSDDETAPAWAGDGWALHVNDKVYRLGDTVTMKKAHPCGGNSWEIIRMGMDIRIKCVRCGRSVLMSRADFERSIKRVDTRPER
jgi:hypothetical protein